MATVTLQERKQGGVQDLNFTTLNGTDDKFVHKTGSDQLLIFKNDSGSSITPVLVGSATSFNPPGYQPPINVSTGYNVGAIANDDEKVLFVSSIREILGTGGDVAINSASGLKVALIEN